MHFQFTHADTAERLIEALILCPVATYVAGILAMIFAARHINANKSQCCCQTAPRYMRVGFVFGAAVSIALSMLVVPGEVTWGMAVLAYMGANLGFGAMLALGGGFVGRAKHH